MARKTRSPEVIERIRNSIIEESMKLILEKGFDNMSLRKLADRVGMSATNLYYYYASKDEIYLNIQIKGFRLLQSGLENIRVSNDDPLGALEQMIRAYLNFGFTHPDYYQIMLTSQLLCVPGHGAGPSTDAGPGREKGPGRQEKRTAKPGPEPFSRPCPSKKKRPWGRK